MSDLWLVTWHPNAEPIHRAWFDHELAAQWFAEALEAHGRRPVMCWHGKVAQ